METKNNKKVLIFGLTFIVIVIGIAAGLTYAFFSASVEGNNLAEPTVIETANLRLVLNDTNVLNMNNIMPGASASKTFTVTNTGNAASQYDILLTDVSTTFTGSDLVYTVTSTNNGGTKTETVLPNTDETIIYNTSVDAGVTQTYTLTITFKETGLDQNANQGATYSGKIQISPRITNVAISGYVTDANGDGIANQTVELHSNPISTTTNEEGYYEFRNVESGVHTIYVKNNGTTIGSKEVTLVLANQTVYTTDGTLKVESAPTKYVNLQVETDNSLTVKVEEATLMLSETSSNIYKGGDNKNLTISGKGYGTLSCSSSDNAKATCSISNNILTITPGTTLGEGTITVSENKFNKTATYTFTNLDTSISLSETSGTGYVGTNLTATVTGENMGILYCGTSDSSKATCSITGTTLTIVPVALGPATITVREGNGNKTATYEANISSLYLKSIIIAAETPQSDANVDFSKTSEAGNTNGLYYTANATTYGEDNTRIYYYRGNVTNNWVTFGGYLWRIVRTTSEGGVRLAYAGVSGTTLTTSSAFINTSTKFNSSYNSKYYVGYTYNTSSYTGAQTNSTIKGVIDTWYTNNLKTNYESYLSKTAVYCNDRSAEQNSSGGAWTSGNVYYPAHNRLETNKRPTFACSSTNASRYTANASTGNGYLTNPIALLTADEVSYAGLVYSSPSTTQSYIMNNATGVNYWWTMSPGNFGVSGSYASEWSVCRSGDLYHGGVNYTNGVRPVVSLNSCITVTEGNGSESTPYEISNSSCS